jgi:hypothetical protein
MLETRRHRLGVEERYLASSRFLRAVGGVEGWRDLLTTLNTLVVDASSSSVAFPSSLLLLLRHKTHRYHPHTHTHTQPKWRRLRLCATFFYILFYFFKDFFLSLKMDRIPLHFFVLLWRLSITGKL